MALLKSMCWKARATPTMAQRTSASEPRSICSDFVQPEDVPTARADPEKFLCCGAGGDPEILLAPQGRDPWRPPISPRRIALPHQRHRARKLNDKRENASRQSLVTNESSFSFAQTELNGRLPTRDQLGTHHREQVIPSTSSLSMTDDAAYQNATAFLEAFHARTVVVAHAAELDVISEHPIICLDGNDTDAPEQDAAHGLPLDGLKRQGSLSRQSTVSSCLSSLANALGSDNDVTNLGKDEKTPGFACLHVSEDSTNNALNAQDQDMQDVWGYFRDDECTGDVLIRPSTQHYGMVGGMKASPTHLSVKRTVFTLQRSATTGERNSISRERFQLSSEAIPSEFDRTMYSLRRMSTM